MLPDLFESLMAGSVNGVQHFHEFGRLGSAIYRGFQALYRLQEVAHLSRHAIFRFRFQRHVHWDQIIPDDLHHFDRFGSLIWLVLIDIGDSVRALGSVQSCLEYLSSSPFAGWHL